MFSSLQCAEWPETTQRPILLWQDRKRASFHYAVWKGPKGKKKADKRTGLIRGTLDPKTILQWRAWKRSGAKRSEKLPIQKYSSTTKGYINSKPVSWQLPLYKRTNNLLIIQRSIFQQKIEQKGGILLSRPTIREKNKRTLLLGHFKRRASLSISLSLSLL